MKKLVLMMAVACTMSATSFAQQKDKAKEKCTAGKECCKKMSKATAAEKTKCAKACAEKSKKAA